MAKIAIIESRNQATIVGSSSSIYFFLASNCRVSDSTEVTRRLTLRTAGTLSNFWVYVTANGVLTSTWRTRKGGANGNLAVTIASNTSGAFEDTSNSDVVSAGELWNTALTTGANGSGSTMGCNLNLFLFEATTNTSHKIGCGGFSYAVASSTAFISPYGSDASSATENNVEITCRISATLKNLCVNVSANARTNATTIGSRKNGAAGALTVSVGAGATGQFEDTSNSDSLVSGDTYNGFITTGTGTESISMSWFADLETTDGTTEYAMGRSTGLSPTISTTTFYTIAGQMYITTAGEAECKHEINMVLTFSKLRCWVSANTVSATSTLKLRVNGADGNQSVSITASTTGLFEDASNSDTTTAASLLSHSLTTGGSGTSLTFHSTAMKAAAVASTQPPRSMHQYRLRRAA